MELIAHASDLGFQIVAKGCLIQVLLCNRIKSFLWPVSEPVNCAAVNKRGVHADPFLQSWSSGTHTQNNMQAFLDFFRKVVHQLVLVGWMVQVMSSFITGVDSTGLAYRNLIVFTEDTRNFVLVYEIVNVCQHVAVFHILVIQKESTILTLKTGFHHQVFKLLNPVVLFVIFRLFRLHNFLVHKIRRQDWKAGTPRSAKAD